MSKDKPPLPPINPGDPPRRGRPRGECPYIIKSIRRGFCLKPHQYRKIMKLGGSKFLQRILDGLVPIVENSVLTIPLTAGIEGGRVIKDRHLNLLILE